MGSQARPASLLWPGATQLAQTKVIYKRTRFCALPSRIIDLAATAGSKGVSVTPTHPPPCPEGGHRRGCRGPPFLSGCSSPRGPGCSPLHARAVFPGLPGCAGALQCWLRLLPLLVGGVVDGDAPAAGEQVIHPIGAGFILSFPPARVVLVLLGRRRRRRVGAARQVRGLVVPVHTAVHFVLVEVEKLPGSGPAAQQPGRSHRRRPGAAGGRGGAAASARSRGGEAGALGAGLHRRAGGRGRHGRRLLQPPPSLAAVQRRGAGVGSGNQSGQQGRRGRRRRGRRGRGAAGAAAGRPEPHAAVAAGRGGGGVQRRGVKAEVVREAGAAPAPHTLRGLPDLHPQRIRGAFLLGLDPGHAGIHPRPPASNPHGPARAPRRRPLTASRALPRLSAPGPAAALDAGQEQQHVSRGGGKEGGRAAAGGGQSRARPGERGSGGAEAAQTVPGPALPEELPSPFQCGVPLARARTGTAHAPQILNLHWRRPPWQPHMRASRPGGRGRARRGRWEAGGRRTSERLSLATAHARLAGVGRVRKRSETLGKVRKPSNSCGA